MSYFAKGNEYYNSRDYTKALSYYNMSIDCSEEVPLSYYNAGVCYIKLKDYDRAIIYFKHALNLSKNDKYYFNLGYCYSMINEYLKAYNSFMECKKLNPNDKDCDKAINLILKSHPEYAEDEIKLDGEIHIKDSDTIKEIDVRKLELITEDNNDKLTLNILQKQRELLDKIDIALDNNDKAEFIKLSKRLNKLLSNNKELVFN